MPDGREQESFYDGEGLLCAGCKGRLCVHRCRTGQDGLRMTTTDSKYTI